MIVENAFRNVGRTDLNTKLQKKTSLLSLYDFDYSQISRKYDKVLQLTPPEVFYKLNFLTDSKNKIELN